MKTLVLFESQYGNTKKIAETIGTQLKGEGPVNIAPIGGFTAEYLDGVDLLVVGGPTQVHGITPAMRQFLSKLDGKSRTVQTAAFDTRIKGPGFLWGSAAKEIESKLRLAGFDVIAPPESFLVTLAKEPLLQPGEERRAGKWAASIVSHARRDLPLTV